MMGFPPDYLDIEFNGKPACKTSQCKAVGNSIAVPILKFIGERIDKYKTLQII